MHSQVQLSETLQALRAEVEAVTTFQGALNRIAHAVDPEALTLWDGPRVEDVDDVAGDDGSFSREAVTELRARAGAALADRYREVERVVLGRAALESLLRATLATGTGGVSTAEGPTAPEVLNALARSGALRGDWATAAAAHVKEVLEVGLPGPRPTVPATPRAKGLPETAAPKKKKVAAAKKVSKKAAPKAEKKSSAAKKKTSAKKTSAPKAKKKAPAKKKSR